MNALRTLTGIGISIAIFAAGCSSHNRAGVRDLAEGNADFSTGNRGVDGGDLAKSATDDLRPGADVAPSEDLAPGADLSSSDDLAAGADLASASTADFAFVADMVVLAPPSDLSPKGGDMIVVGTTKPTITTFTGPSITCPGTITLSYNFAGGPGVITPGDVSVAAGSGTVNVTLPSTNTKYTLTVTNSAGTATQAFVVGSYHLPNATITGPPNLAVNQLTQLQVPGTDSLETYQWAPNPADLSGATIVGASTQAFVMVKPTKATASMLVDVTITNPGCALTNTITVPLPCDVPTLISLTPTGTPPVADPMPDGHSTRAVSFRSLTEAWAVREVQKPTPHGGGDDIWFARLHNGVWGPPAGAPHPLNNEAYWVLDTQDVSDEQGDALFVWTQDDSTNGNMAKAMLRGYNATTDTWSAIQTVGADSINDNTTVHVSMNPTTGDAVIAWLSGPYTTPIPHLRRYNVKTDTLGPDLPIEPSTTSYYAFLPLMDLDLATSDNLDGFVTWFEEANDSTGNVTMYGLHLTAGVPDLNAAKTAYDIVPLVVGSHDTTAAVLNVQSLHGESYSAQFRGVAVAQNGNAAIVWNVYNGDAPTASRGTLWARRYIDGAWNADEIVATAPQAWSVLEWAIADNGLLLIVSQDNANGSYGYHYTSASVGGTFTPPGTLLTTIQTPQPHLSMVSATGKAIVTFGDLNTGHGHVALFDPATQTFGTSFQYSDPNQLSSGDGRPYLDPSGEMRIAFMQQTSASGAYSFEFVNACRAPK